MIDGFKIGFYNRHFRSILDSLGIKISLTDSTNPKAIKQSVRYRSLIITMYHNGHVEMRGSLHKFYKGENYSDFTYKELCEAVDKLCLDFRLDPYETKLQTLEFGVNVSPHFNAEYFCSRLLSYKNDPFESLGSGYASKNLGFTCVNQQYEVKCYDKGRQYSELGRLNILRFELAAKKMLFVKKARIRTLSDLKNQDNLIVLGDILRNAYRKILFHEEIDVSQLSEIQLRDYTTCIDTRNWHKIDYRKRYRYKQGFMEIMKKFAETNLKETVNYLIEEKFFFLLLESSGVIVDDMKSPLAKYTDILPVKIKD